MIVDHRKELSTLYGAKREPSILAVPPLSYLMIDGHGDPNVSRAYSEAVEALYSLSFAVKFAVKRETCVDYRVMPLEGLWWCEDMRRFSVENKADWSWTLMILQPPEAGTEIVEKCRGAVAEKKQLRALGEIHHARFDEGHCAQILHVGPFSEEGPIVERLHAFIEREGGRLAGKHHEIYLSDIRRAAPEKWRTIIRQPFTPRARADRPAGNPRR
jgi:hypothetical protein